MNTLQSSMEVVHDTHRVLKTETTLAEVRIWIWEFCV